MGEMTIQARGLRTARRLAHGTAAAGLALCCAATAQVIDQSRVKGTFTVGTPAAARVIFDCTGLPTCTGRFIARILEQGCSNPVTFADAFTMTGLQLAQRGSLQGTIRLANALNHVVRNADGTCSHRENVPDFVAPFTGDWDGLAATFSFPQSQGPPVTGAFKVELPPIFEMAVRANIDAARADASADIHFRPQDIGTTGRIFTFAMIPETRVPREAGAVKLGYAKDARKAETPIGCVLAQLNASGQMVAVTSANLGAYLTGVLGAQGSSVTILNGVPTGNVSGATFFVGYGASGTSMINTGTNRAVVTVPGSLTCEPAAPQTGWWWNPLEDGRGFTLEKRGNNLFFASFLYDISGRSTWYVSSGPVSLDGTLYNGDLLAASGGQTLGGPYPGFPTLASVGSMTLTFNNESTGTLVWPGGTVPIQRFNIIPNGLTAAPVAGVPESGWWWNESESGRGFFMEWQGPTLDIAAYVYDDAGNSIWNLTVGDIGGTPAARTFSGTWWSYGNGQTLTGAWKPNARINSNVAPVTITFSGPDTALMTLPNGRTTSLKRHRF